MTTPNTQTLIRLTMHPVMSIDLVEVDTLYDWGTACYQGKYIGTVSDHSTDSRNLFRSKEELIAHLNKEILEAEVEANITITELKEWINTCRTLIKMATDFTA